MQVAGDTAATDFANEPGGHRFQRVPPTEKRGRVHTSTVTVAVLPLLATNDVHLDDRDLEWKATRGSGPGGQHRNKTDSCVQMKHVPTGLTVRVETERSQHQNLATARAVLAARLVDAAASSATDARNSARRQQVGSGMRGDKVRTIALQRDQVTDHRTGRRMSAAKYLRGDLSALTSP